MREAWESPTAKIVRCRKGRRGRRGDFFRNPLRKQLIIENGPARRQTQRWRRRVEVTAQQQRQKSRAALRLLACTSRAPRSGEILEALQA